MSGAPGRLDPAPAQPAVAIEPVEPLVASHFRGDGPPFAAAKPLIRHPAGRRSRPEGSGSESLRRSERRSIAAATGDSSASYGMTINRLRRGILRKLRSLGTLNCHMPARAEQAPQPYANRGTLGQRDGERPLGKLILEERRLPVTAGWTHV